MKRAVVTLVRETGEPFLDECVESVRKANVPHIIVECGKDWGQMLYKLRNVADAVAWVDSDDYIFPDVMNKAFEVMESTNVGVVYTDETVISDGKILYNRRGDYTLNDLRNRAFTIHHLAITRRNTIGERAKKCIDQMKTMYDWPMRIDAMIHSGAQRVPEIGYAWRRYKGQDSHSNPHLGESMKVVIKEYAQCP